MAVSANYNTLSTNNTSMTISLSSAPTSGQFLFLWLVCDRNATSITAPTGFTTLASKESGTNDIYLAAYKFSDGTEGTDFTVSMNVTGGMSGGIVVIDDVDTANPINVSGFTSGITSPTAPSVTTTVDNCVVLRLAGLEQPYNWNSWSDTSTELWDGGYTTSPDPAKASSEAAYFNQGTAGVVGSASITATSTSYCVGGTVAIALTTAVTTGTEVNNAAIQILHSVVGEPQVTNTAIQVLWKLVSQPEVDNMAVQVLYRARGRRSVGNII